MLCDSYDGKVENMKRGQYFTLDAMVGAILFLVTVGTVLNYWYLMQAVIDARGNPEYMVAFRIADQLISSPGDPIDWETNPANANTFGLATSWSNRVLSYDKWTALKNYSNNHYEDARSKLHTAGYDYYITVKTFGTCGGLDENAGSVYPANATVAKVTRIAPFEHGGSTCAANLTVYVWRAY